MTGNEKKIVGAAAAAALMVLLAPAAGAMHIMEGYLPAGYCLLWGAVCLPFLADGVLTVRRRLRENRSLITLLAMSGAFVFVISSLKIPSVTGSCSHMTGTGLGAILFGPAAVSVLGLIVLIFQAVLLAHGGLTTLGANTFSMAVAGPLVTWGIYRLGCRLKWNRRVTVFLAAALGDLFTYCVTAFQLALAHHGDVSFGTALTKFLLVFAPTQVPLALIEGLITALIVMGLETYARPELRAAGYFGEEK